MSFRQRVGSVVGNSCLSNVNAENIIMNPVIGSVCGIGKKKETLRKLHRLTVVDDEVAADGNQNALGAAGGGRLTVAGDYLVGDLVEWQLLRNAHR